MSLAFPKPQKRLRDQRWMNAVRFIPCVVTGYQYVDGAAMGVDPAHIRWGLHAGSRKPDDNRVLPLVHKLHQASNVEVEFWRGHFHGQLRDRAMRREPTMMGVRRGIANWHRTI